MEDKKKPNTSVLYVILSGIAAIVVVMAYLLFMNSDIAIKKLNKEVDYFKNDDYPFSEYDNKYLSGLDCKSAITLFKNSGDVDIVFKAKGSDLESDYESVDDFYCLPKKSLDRRVFESQMETDENGNLKKLIFTLKEPMRDRVSYSANLNQLNERNKFKERFITDLGGEAVYNDVTHVYLTADPTKYVKEELPVIDTSKLYDIYELLDSNSYGRIGYYLKESEEQH